MNIFKIAFWVLAEAQAAPSFRRGAPAPRARGRALQFDCSSVTKRNQCPRDDCIWNEGADPPCVPSAVVTTLPTRSPTPSPTSEQIYCGCPDCTETIWNTNACLNGECHTCGSRILFMQGSLSPSDACKSVAEEFPNGPCSPVCNPDLCNLSDVPTAGPSKLPSKSPSTRPSPTEKFFCGCPECTASVWNYDACAGSECDTCGSRITYLQSTQGKSVEEACAQVSQEFPNNECGPACNPLLCNPEYLDEPDESNLLWSDEFDVDGSPDASRWDYDIGNGCPNLCGWGNGELQYYSNDASNVWVDNGVLRISAKRDLFGEYTSARMVTRGRQAFRYGRVRFRASVANCQAIGTWPALWMLPEDWLYGGWPNSGEIDVMETFGHEADMFFGSIHTEMFNHANGTEKTGSADKLKTEWHIFEIDWQMDIIRFAIDGLVYYQFSPDDVTDYTKWPFDQDFHILMNIAVGGTWGTLSGLYDVDGAAFDGDGQYMDVDWVRVYNNNTNESAQIENSHSSILAVSPGVLIVSFYVCRNQIK